MDDNTFNPEGDYVAVKALESNVSIIGLTRGDETKSHHTEKLDRDEVLLMQFTSHTSAIKIKGKAEVYTKYGKILSGKEE